MAAAKLKSLQRDTRITNCYNLAMCGWIVRRGDKIGARCDDLPIANDDRAERPSASGRDVLRRQRYPYCTGRAARVTE